MNGVQAECHRKGKIDKKGPYKTHYCFLNISITKC